MSQIICDEQINVTDYFCIVTDHLTSEIDLTAHDIYNLVDFSEPDVFANVFVLSKDIVLVSETMTSTPEAVGDELY